MPDVLCSEAQTTTSTTAPTTAPTTASTVPVNGNNVIPALAANAPPTRRTQNVFERNGKVLFYLMSINLCRLGFFLVLCCYLNELIFIEKYNDELYNYILFLPFSMASNFVYVRFFV